MIEVVIGEKGNAAVADQLIEAIRGLDPTGTLYIGYPLLAKTQEPQKFLDGLLTSREHGVVLFDLQDYPVGAEEAIRERQDDLYAALQDILYAHKPLRKGRDLGLRLNVVTIRPGAMQADVERLKATHPDLLLATPHALLQLLITFDAISEEYLQHINAVLQNVTALRPPLKRATVKRPDSKGAIIKRIESAIANLDKWQKRAAIEMPEGPQRIRGLAGSGKTVVLAWKAAELHARHPEWRVVITFHTRAMYQQIKALVRRFSLTLVGDEPDWTRLQVLHSWGSRSQSGVYSVLATDAGAQVRDFLYAKEKYGAAAGFAEVCNELLQELRTRGVERPLFDALLIDEAQDFPQSFFELAYEATRDPKRIVWAYDELQNLGHYSMAPPEELFGTDTEGRPRVRLENQPNEAQQDIILPVCYRNTPWALTTAHGVGFGVYRNGGLVQFFDDPQLWEDIGYRVRAGRFAAAQTVSLERDTRATPSYFADLLRPRDAVSAHVFANVKDQDEWLVTQVRQNLEHDELLPQDILIILSDPVTVPKEAAPIMAGLREAKIRSHIAGVSSSKDALFMEDSVALTGIYRAKGNEAPMVYVLNAQFGASRSELIRRRNILFTGMTRSRAWLRVAGWGPGMDLIQAEMDAVAAKGYALEFRVPTAQELQKLRQIHRDMTDDERMKAKRAEEQIRRAAAQLKQLREGHPQIELSSETLEDLRELFPDWDDS
jgi:superfamily I DNA and RNA helicase